MSEEESPVIKIRVINRSFTGTTNDTYQYRVTLAFESPTKAAGETVVNRFRGMEMTTETTLFDEALAIAKQEVVDAKAQGMKKERELQIQINQLLQTTALQTKEIQRLKKIEDSLNTLSQLAAMKPVPPELL